MRLVAQEQRQQFAPLSPRALLRDGFCESERSRDRQRGCCVASRQLLKQQGILDGWLLGCASLGIRDGLRQSQLPNR
jgi:hypothetical protein